MPYCPSCAVEVEERLKFCPLCDNDLQDEKPEVTGEYPGTIPGEELDNQVTRGVKRAWTLMGFSILGLITMTICAIVDIVQGPEVDWANYVHLSAVGVIAILALIFYLHDHPLILFCGLVAVATALVFGADGISPPLTWSKTIGLPVIISFFSVFGTWIYIHIRLGPSRTTSTVLLLAAIGIFCLLLDWRIEDRAATVISWSIPVAICLLVLSAGLLFTVRILKRDPRWKRHFDL